MNQFEEKRAARIERMRDRADKLRSNGENRVEHAHKMASVIPFGQPILVGHHSEGRDRRYRAKIERNFRRGFEDIKAADALESRAESAESSTAIFSDDPDAVEKLEAKAAELEKQRERAKAINRAARNRQPKAALEALGLGPSEIERVLMPDFAGRIGVPGYALTNLSAEIRRTRDRIEAIKRHATEEGRELVVGDVKIVWEENRVRLRFPDKPDAETRAELKRAGFRWAHSLGVWQRHASEYAWHEAKCIAERGS